ncbi:molybdopterin-binding protein, partial [Jeotgalibaca porci]
MKAEIISVGSSLLTGRAVNENAAFLTRELTALGITIAEVVMIAEEPE